MVGMEKKKVNFKNGYVGKALEKCLGKSGLQNMASIFSFRTNTHHLEKRHQKTKLRLGFVI